MFRLDLWCNLDTLQILEPISEHKTKVNEAVNLYTYLRFGNIKCTAGPNGNFCLTEVTGMDKNGCDMPNGINFVPFWALGVLWVRVGENEELEIL